MAYAARRDASSSCDSVIVIDRNQVLCKLEHLVVPVLCVAIDCRICTCASGICCKLLSSV